MFWHKTHKLDYFFWKTTRQLKRIISDRYSKFKLLIIAKWLRLCREFAYLLMIFYFNLFLCLRKCNSIFYSKCELILIWDLLIIIDWFSIYMFVWLSVRTWKPTRYVFLSNHSVRSALLFNVFAFYKKISKTISMYFSKICSVY